MTDFPTGVRSLLPALPALPRAVAQLLLDEPQACAERSLGELAERANTSEATVARTARLLGYHGYRQLRMALVAYAAKAGEPDGERLFGPVSAEDELPTVIAKLTRDGQDSLGDTAHALDVDALRRAVELVGAARRVDIYGLMTSGLVAQDLAHKLLRIGIAAQAHTEMHVSITSALQLRGGDVAIGISHSGNTAEVIEPLQRAAEAGADTIAITGNAQSAITAVAGEVLFAAEGRGTELPPVSLSSRFSQLLVVDCLFIGMAKARKGSIEALQSSLDALAPKHHRGAKHQG